MVADFKHAGKHGHRGVRHRAAADGTDDLPGLMREAGFTRIETGEFELLRLPGLPDAGFAYGTSSGVADTRICTEVLTGRRSIQACTAPSPSDLSTA